MVWTTTNTTAMKSGAIMGYIGALVVGVYMVYLMFEAAKKSEYDSINFWGPLVGLLAVVLIPVGLTMHGKSKAKE